MKRGREGWEGTRGTPFVRDYTVIDSDSYYKCVWLNYKIFPNTLAIPSKNYRLIHLHTC